MFDHNILPQVLAFPPMNPARPGHPGNFSAWSM